MFYYSPNEQQQPGSGETPKILSAVNEEGLVSSSFLKWATWLLLAYFCMRLVFFALAISASVPPDEVTHAGLCRVFSKVFLLPVNSPETYEFGLVTNTPWLYYWIMGKLLHLNFFGIPELIFLRLLNIPLAFGTLWYVLRLLRLLTGDRLAQLLLLVVMTNTAMFSFLSASVSYDNLANLLAAMATYYLLAFFKYRSGNLLAASILCQLAGSLTKASFLALVPVMSLLLIIHEWKNLHHFPAALRGYFQTAGHRVWWLALAILIAFGLNLQLHAGDYLHYGSLTPTMSDVIPSEKSMENRIVARETIFRLYTEGKISYMEALVMTGEIKHPGDKADTFYLLMNYENLKRNPALWMGLPQYAKVWFEGVTGSIFGIKAHQPMFKDYNYLVPFYVVMAFALLGFCVRWRPRESGWLPACLATIACFYAGFIMYKINYNSYLYYGTPGITLQGRYLFPVIAPVYVLMCHYLLVLFRAEYLRLALALATALLFISCDFPYFLMHATPKWFVWPL
jgi:hypothetical protein